MSGAVPTKGAFSRLDPDGSLLKQKVELPPNWRLGHAEEVANLATYLVSDYSSWLNGEVIRIDGAAINYLAGDFNRLSDLGKEQWDVMEQMIKGVKGS